MSSWGKYIEKEKYHDIMVEEETGQYLQQISAAFNPPAFGGLIAADTQGREFQGKEEKGK